jgi:signal transduction histidine kinase
MQWRWGLRLPVRLWMRIAGMMMLAVLAVEALNTTVFLILPARHLTLYSAHWLIGKVEEAAQTIFQADTSARKALSAKLEEGTRLRFRWHPGGDGAAPNDDAVMRPFLEQVRTTLEKHLQGKVAKVTVKGLIGVRGNQFRVDLQYHPPGFADQQAETPLARDGEDVPIAGLFQLGIQGLDGSWIMIEPDGMPFYLAQLQPWITTLLGAAVFVSLLAIGITRRLLRPLDHLAESARNFGRTRKPVPIGPADLVEVEVIGQAMNNMQERIKRFLDERTHMLAAVSHDLRTGLTRLLLDAEELPQGQVRERLVEGMEEMEKLISATLAFAGDDLKSEPLQKVDLAALLISLCDAFSDRNYDASYSGPDHLFATCQPVAIKRALSNLIDNAIKYGGCARVALWQSHNQAAIAISDEGPGIPQDKIELVFKPFRRLENSRSRETGGVGLGLTIARDIVQSHGGEISLGRPALGNGLEVRVMLPLLQPVPAL